jgi:hypothetical protein
LSFDFYRFRMSVVVVLGQSLNPDGTPPSSLCSRIELAATEWKLNHNLILLLCGGDPARTGKSEAQVMKDLLLPLGVDPNSIILEEQSLSTLQNAFYSFSILKERNISEIMLLSSEFHIPRAEYLFEAFFAYMASLGEPLVTIQSLSATTPPPHERDVGINQLTLKRRLADEKRYLLERVVKDFLPRHIPHLPIPPLPHSRLEQAICAVELMMERLES